MTHKLNAEETLEYLIGVLKCNLDELYGALPAECNRHFVLGEKTAYVECLEIIQLWDKSADRGLNGAIEQNYPL